MLACLIVSSFVFFVSFSVRAVACLVVCLFVELFSVRSMVCLLRCLFVSVFVCSRVCLFCLFVCSFARAFATPSVVCLFARLCVCYVVCGLFVRLLVFRSFVCMLACLFDNSFVCFFRSFVWLLV